MSLNHDFQKWVNLGLLATVIVLASGVHRESHAQTEGFTTPAAETLPVTPPQTPVTSPTSQSDINQSDINPVTEIDTLDIPANLEDITIIEKSFAGAYAGKFGPFFGEIATGDDISNELGVLARATNTNPALLYVIRTAEGLQVVLVTADQGTGDPELGRSTSKIKLASSQIVPISQGSSSADDLKNPNVTFIKIPEATVEKVTQTANDFREQISDPVDFKSKTYLKSAQQLHTWIVGPLADKLKEKKVDTLVFAMDTGLRSLPIAALHDGQQFLVEKYNLALLPSFSLTDTRYSPIQGKQVLGMGITKAVDGQSPLPSVAVEIPTLTNDIWQGEPYLNEDATLSNLKEITQQQRFDIIHLATHAEFQSGDNNQSYIQLWDQQLTLQDLREVATQSKWNGTPTIELLVLSACQTALGDKDAELGFTGLAIQSGVKSALGSLWFVSDEGTLGLMTEFYKSLKTAPIKSAALRQAQIALLSGQVRVTDDAQLVLADGTQIDLPDIAAERGEVDFTHPYYWSSFTMVGNWN